MNDFSAKIKTLRKEKKQTQQEIAELLGVRRSTYGEYERGKIVPPLNKIKILADHFNVSIDYFVGNVENTEIESIDVSKQLKLALDYLKTQEKLNFNGTPLDNESREMLISSLENGLKMAKLISKGRENE